MTSIGRQLDLDARIELLLKGKVNAALAPPAFLTAMLDGSSSDNSKNSSRSSSRNGDWRSHSRNNQRNRSPFEDECHSPAISPPPSPFLSKDIYMEHYRAAHVAEVADRTSPTQRDAAPEALDDEMSLSSLSSGEEKILNSGQPLEPAGGDAPPGDAGAKAEGRLNAMPPSFVGSFYAPPPPTTPADPYFAWRGLYGVAGTSVSYPPPSVYPSATGSGAAYPAYSYPPPNGYSSYLTDVQQQAAAYAAATNAQAADSASRGPSQTPAADNEAPDPHLETIQYVLFSPSFTRVMSKYGPTVFKNNYCVSQ